MDQFWSIKFDGRRHCVNTVTKHPEDSVFRPFPSHRKHKTHRQGNCLCVRSPLWVLHLPSVWCRIATHIHVIGFPSFPLIHNEKFRQQTSNEMLALAGWLNCVTYQCVCNTSFSIHYLWNHTQGQAGLWGPLMCLYLLLYNDDRSLCQSWLLLRGLCITCTEHNHWTMACWIVN